MESTISIDWVCPENLDDVWQFEESAGTTWPHPRWFFEESIRYQRMLLARDGNSAVGYLLYEVIWGNTAFLSLLKVKPSHQRRGIGKAMVGELEKRLRELGFKSYTTSTELVNQQTKRFFPDLGFVHIGDLNMQHGVEVFYIKDLSS